MFSQSRRIVEACDRRPEEATEPNDDPFGVQCRVKIVTRGLALLLAVLLVGLAHLAQSPSPSPAPAAFATCDGFRGYPKALARPAADRLLHGCLSDGTLTAWNPGSSLARVGTSQGTIILGAAFAPDGSTLAVVELEGLVALWDLANWRRRAEISPRSGTAEALAFSSDSTTLATTDGTGVRLWDVTTADPNAGPRLDLHGIKSLAFAADGRTLAVGTQDGAVRLWDPARGSQCARFRAHSDIVSSLAFSADGRVLATSSNLDRIARLWEMGAGRLLRELECGSVIQAIAFAPGGRALATASYDGTVRLWDVATGGSRWVVSEGDGPVMALAFSADGATLTCGGVGAIRLYRLDLASRMSAR